MRAEYIIFVFPRGVFSFFRSNALKVNGHGWKMCAELTLCNASGTYFLMRPGGDEGGWGRAGRRKLPATAHARGGQGCEAHIVGPRPVPCSCSMRSWHCTQVCTVGVASRRASGISRPHETQMP